MLNSDFGQRRAELQSQREHLKGQNIWNLQTDMLMHVKILVNDKAVEIQPLSQ